MSKSWISSFVDECGQIETPKIWLLWSAICTISAITAPNVRLKRGKYFSKPNLYVLLFGDSGLTKGFGPSVSKKLVDMVGNTRVISGRGSIEGIIKELAINKSRADGSVPYKDARGYLVSGEFSSSLLNSDDALIILTDLYDAHYHEDWKNTLKNSPVEHLRFPCITMLSGTNQSMFDMMIDKSHHESGLIGRTLLIKADKKERYNAFTDDTEPPFDFEMLAAPLKELATVKGDFWYTPGGKSTFEEWYYGYCESKQEDKTGTSQRLHEHVLKVAMILNLSRGADLKLSQDDIEQAIDLCLNLSSMAKFATSGSGESDIAKQVRIFIEILIANDGTISRAGALRKGHGRFDHMELDKIVTTLQQAQFITQYGDKEIVYKVNEKYRSQFEAIVKRVAK